MIDKLQGIARAIRFLQVPSMLIGAICLLSMTVILISTESNELERFLRPGLLGFVWAVTTYAFIVTFREVPDKPSRAQGVIDKTKQKLSRGWYWFIAVVFLGTLVVMLVFTGRLLSIWLQVV